MAGRLALLAAAAIPAAAADHSEREYAIKAAFLYHFAEYVTWLPGAPKGADGALTIGVLGPDPFGATLDEVAATRSAADRKVAVRRFGAIEGMEPCHILFVSASEVERLGTLLRRAAESGALLVADVRGAAGQGAHINFFIENNKVRFEINPAAARRAGLKISSKLLRLARIVEPPSGGQ